MYALWLLYERLTGSHEALDKKQKLKNQLDKLKDS